MRSLKAYAALVEAELEAHLPASINGVPPHLTEAMRYSLLSGGKRLRPALLLAAVDLLGGDLTEALAPACALEMIHTYSLIHDDLPCMDDDAMRRGRPSNHMVFGEAQALLAGDGLLTHAFFIMARGACQYPNRAALHAQAMHEIAEGAGISGMVGGQCADLLAEAGGPQGEETLEYIQRAKTAGLFVAAMRAGGRISGANDAQMDALGRYGLYFGLLFQAVDDILDVVGDAAALGKSVGKDGAHGKLTTVSALGLSGARARAGQLAGAAKDALGALGGRAAFFAELVDRMLVRDR